VVTSRTDDAVYHEGLCLLYPFSSGGYSYLVRWAKMCVFEVSSFLSFFFFCIDFFIFELAGFSLYQGDEKDLTIGAQQLVSLMRASSFLSLMSLTRTGEISFLELRDLGNP